MTIDDLQDYIVCVEGGSGCLFQPMAEVACTYILTAKHLFIKDKRTVKYKISIKASKMGADGREEYRIPFTALKKGFNYFPHPSKDIAILKIEKQDGVDCLIRTDDLVSDRQGFILAGYPGVRRKEHPNEFLQWYRTNENVVIKELKTNFREANVLGNPNLEEVKGQSGGAIVKLKGEYSLLAGIQNRMTPGDEQLGNIEFSPLSNFDEIVERFPDDLAPLHAPHLRCFSFLREHIFNLEAGFGEEDVVFTIQSLRAKTVEIVGSTTTPYFIKDFFKTKLLVHQQDAVVLQTKDLWIAWLEFLIILNIAKSKVHTLDELGELFNSYRLLFSNNKGCWSKELLNLVYSDYSGLRDNGLVVVGTPEPPHNRNYKLDNTIPLVTRAMKTADRSRLKIDDGISFPLERFRFYHLDYFKNGSISNRSEEYREITSDAVLMTKLKQEYEQLFHDD